MATEKFYIDDAKFRIYCGNCKTPTARELTVRETAGLCGMANVVCDVCGHEEDEPVVKSSKTEEVMDDETFYHLMEVSDSGYPE